MPRPVYATAKRGSPGARLVLSALLGLLGFGSARAAPTTAAPTTATTATTTPAQTAAATAQASAAFQQAHQLFEQGRYEAALQAYQRSYELAPHPNTLYNLALTHERLLRYEDAIAAFQRFLSAAPDPRQPRQAQTLRILAQRAVRRMQALPARLSVTAVPTQVEVSVEPIPSLDPAAPGEPAATGEPAAPLAGPPLRGRTPTLFTVPAGRYTLRLREGGYFDEVVTVEAHVGEALLVQRQLKERPRRLVVSSALPVTLHLDARPLGKTPYDGEVAVGRHYLRAERLFYLTDNRTFDVAPGPGAVTLRIPLQRSGLYDMLAGGAVAGAALGLFATRLATDLPIEQTRSPLGAALGALVPAALGAGLFAFASGSDMPAAEAQLIVGTAAWGTTLGLGLGLGILPGIPNLAQNGLLPHLMSAGLGLMGGVAGLAAHRLRHPSSGAAAVYNSAALWGTVSGSLIWGYLAAHDSRLNFFGGRGGSSGFAPGGWALFSGTLIGVGAGVVAARLSPADLTRAQVGLMDLCAGASGLTAGLLGLGVGYGATGVWQADGRESATSVAALAALTGTAAGLLAAVLLQRYLPRRPGGAGRVWPGW